LTIAIYLKGFARFVDHQGQQDPYIEQQTMFKNDAIGFKCRHEFGVGLMDYRGLYKNPGA